MSRVGERLSHIHRVGGENSTNAPKTLNSAIAAHSDFDLLVQRYNTLLYMKQNSRDVEQLQKLGREAENLKTKIKK